MPPTFSDVCEKALRLPCSPTLLPRLIVALESEDAAIDEIEAVIQVDTSLASATLRLANSAYFASGSRVESLSEALMRLGHREIYRLAALALAGRWFSQEIQGYGWEQGDFARMAVVTAVSAEFLAERSNCVDPRAAYTAGLVHEIGKLAVAFACGSQFSTIRTVQAERKCPWIEAEKEVLGYTHAEVGAALLERWKFPSTLIAAAVHNPPQATTPAEVLPLVVHVHAGKYLATTIGAGVAEDGFLYSLNGALLLEWGFTPETLSAAMPPVLDRASKLLRESLNSGPVKF